MVTFPPCLVTFPRCLIAITGASHRCTLISLKCLIIGDIAMQQVEKHFMAVEVIAVQFFSIFVLQSVRRFILAVLYNSSWSLASLYFSYYFICPTALEAELRYTARPITFSCCWDLWVLCKQFTHQFRQTSTLTTLPKPYWWVLVKAKRVYGRVLGIACSCIFMDLKYF